MNKVIIRLLTVILFVPVVLFPQNLTKSGTTGAQFLKIGVGPRAIGMGSAFTATANDVSAIYWNPAGVASNYTSEAIFNHTDWIIDVDLDYAAVTTYLDGIGTIGTFVNVMTMDEMSVRTIEKPEGTGEYFRAGALAIGLTYARNLTDNFAIGFNLKYISEYIWNSSSSALAIDIGTLYRIPVLNEFRIGASISNFGTKMQMDGRDQIELFQVGYEGGNLINTKVELDEFDLPLIFRAGVAADLVKSEKNRLTLGIDAVHPNDHYEYLNTGAEYSWNEIVMIRAGYKSLFEAYSEEGLTLGAGLRYRLMGYLNVSVDYAYQDFGRLKDIHYFAFGIKF